MMELSKKFRFETAHRLAKGYEGKCNKIHGHSWNGELFISAKEFELDEHGMLLDYAELKKITKGVEDWFDHKVILFEGDPMLKGIINMYITQGITDAVVTTKENPTSEHLANLILEYAEEYMHTKSNLHKRGFFVSKVKIKETCTSSCVVTP